MAYRAVSLETQFARAHAVASMVAKGWSVVDAKRAVKQQDANPDDACKDCDLLFANTRHHKDRARLNEDTAKNWLARHPNPTILPEKWRQIYHAGMQARLKAKRIYAAENRRAPGLSVKQSGLLARSDDRPTAKANTGCRYVLARKMKECGAKIDRKTHPQYCPACAAKSARGALNMFSNLRDFSALI